MKKRFTILASLFAVLSISSCSLPSFSFDISVSDLPSVEDSSAEDSSIQDSSYNDSSELMSSEAPSSTSEILSISSELSSSVNKFTITWKNDDGTTIDTTEVDEGTIPSHDAISKASTAQYSYTFIGWDPAPVAATNNASYTAAFSQSTNQYIITWVDGNGDTLKTDKFSYGDTPTYVGNTPTKTSTAQYSYTFNSTWLPEISAVTGDTTYVAQFDETVNKYTVTWKNGTNTLEVDEDVVYGTTPSYDGDTPTREADLRYTYEFTGWSPEISEVTGDITYYAQFNGKENEYTVTWVDGNGNTLKTEQLKYGETPSYTGVTPTKTPEPHHTCSFVGWTPSISQVTGDATYTALFEDGLEIYTITWIDGDGNTLKTEGVAYGFTPEYSGETPTKASTIEKSYAFNGSWSPEIAVATEDATYTAQFNETVHKYTITWKDGNDKTLKTEELEYGTTPVYSGTTPTKSASAQYSYTFNNSWSPSIDVVNADATYVAQFSQTLNSYTITWKNDDGSTIDTTEVDYGATPTHADASKAEDEDYTYTFKGWNPTITSVTGEATYTASYNAEAKINHDSLYFTNNEKWGKVYAYMWTEGKGNNASWPGVPMTQYGTNDNGELIYRITGASQYENIIFNDGGAGAQTEDISIKNLAKNVNAFYLSTMGSNPRHVGTWTQTSYSFGNHGQNILHCLDWSIDTIIANLDEIAAQGFSAIQTSPLQPVKDYDESYSDTNTSWWRFYQPVGLCIANSTSNILFSTDDGAAELTTLTREAAKRGIRVIVDVIVNHLADDSTNASHGYLHPQVAEFEPEIYNNYFDTLHYPNVAKQTTDYSSGWSICMTDSFCKDLNTGNSIVQQQVCEFLMSLVDCGVTGFRFDAAKHVETTSDYGYSSDFWGNTLGYAVYYARTTYGRTVWSYGEILDPGSARSYYSYIKTNDSYGGERMYAVTAEPGWYDISEGCCVTWAESHDSYMDGRTVNDNDTQAQKNSTYAWFAKTYKYANMLYFVRPDVTKAIGGDGYHSDWGWKNGDVRTANARLS